MILFAINLMRNSYVAYSQTIRCELKMFGES